MNSINNKVQFSLLHSNSIELMKQCWENQPDNRPSFATMVKMLHDYVANERNFQVRGLKTINLFLKALTINAFHK
jgi:hypothetical protein